MSNIYLYIFISLHIKIFILTNPLLYFFFQSHFRIWNLKFPLMVRVVPMTICKRHVQLLNPLIMQTCNKLKNHPAPRPATNLILKHEILSKDCDLFRVSLRRKIYFWQIFRVAILVPSVSWLTYHQVGPTKDSLVLKGILGIGIICAIFAFLFLKSIEGK